MTTDWQHVPKSLSASSRHRSALHKGYRRKNLLIPQRIRQISQDRHPFMALPVQLAAGSGDERLKT